MGKAGSQGERGTGGEELRRLRWSSPPGQGEQVPPGFSPGDARGEAPLPQKKLDNPPDSVLQ